jgi:hypothetical protein
MSDKNYGHRDVVDKLNIKPGYLVVLTAGKGLFAADLQQRILARIERPLAAEDEPVDVVIALIDSNVDPVEVLTKWKRRLKPAGGIWLLTPKRGRPGYVDQRELIAAGLATGLVDNKVCSISDEISAIRFVIRIKDRATL